MGAQALFHRKTRSTLSLALIIALLSATVLAHVAGSLAVRPAAVTVSCRPGQEARFTVTVYGRGVYRVTVETAYSYLPGGVKILPAARQVVVDGSAALSFAVECLEPGLYAYRISIAETGGAGGVAAVGSVAATVRVLVKGVAARVWYRWLNSTHLEALVRVESFGVRVENASVNVLVNGVLRLNETVRLPALLHIPLTVRDLAGGGRLEVEVVGFSPSGERYVYSTSKPLPAVPPLSAKLKLRVEAPSTVLAFPGRDTVNIKVNVAVSGNATGCRILTELQAPGATLARSFTSPPTGWMEYGLRVEPLQLLPYHLKFTVWARATCMLGLVKAGDTSQGEILVIPAGFLVLVASTVAAAVLLARKLRARHSKPHEDG